ncbi:DNA cytosine methyltransferase [Bradyrhizobium sp. WSM3983]|uniref:DNA cytosine methyltransferase n=1 Tax=Bradyrhizobium sp. WSM3983 TaxID=1038867 RepID=UPI0007C56509|nr:DNA cytosine methyltransferase [Bradyrhizobium sp. WSM3983]
MPPVVPKIVLHKRTAKKAGGSTCVDLFAGAGGLAAGFRDAGWAILAANDADADAAETFRLNFPEASFFHGPISKLKAKDILNECGLRKGQLDCLIGGPPCQSFSYNNHQRSADDERAGLFRHYLRLVKELKPKMLVMENVPGILTIGNNSVIAEIAKKLSRLGYDIAVRVLSAEEFGTPQVRRRVFIVASRVGKAAALLPKPSHRPAPGVRRPEADDKEQQRGRAHTVTVEQAIGDLPVLRSGGGKIPGVPLKRKAKSSYQRKARGRIRSIHNHICHALTEPMLARISHVPEGGNWRNIPFRLLPAGMQRAEPNDHTKRYGRLSRKGHASTLLTKCDPHWGAYIHPTQQRTISVREAARLQGFSDSFIFAGSSLGAHYTQVGNAVPVPVARAVGTAALSHIESRRRKAKSKSSGTRRKAARRRVRH